MNSSLAAFAASLTGWLADFYLLATLLLVLVMLGFRWVRQPAHRLWAAWIVMIELAALAVACGLPGWPRISLLPAAVPANVAAAEPVNIVLSEPLALPDNFLPAQHVPNDVVAGGPAELPQQPAALLPRWTFKLPPFRSTVGGSFLVGLGLVGLWLACGAVATLVVCGRATSAPLALVAQLAEIVHGVRPPRLLLSRRIGNAAALGVLRPTILLPSEIAERSPPQSVRAVLAHEWAHICNRDLWLLALGRSLLLLLFAHPLYWWLRRQIRNDQELLADAVAAHQSRVDYAEQLLGWARLTTGQPPVRAAAAVGILEGSSQLTRRIAMLLDETFHVQTAASRRWKVQAIGALMLVGAACSLVTLQPAPLVGQQTQAASSARSAPEKDLGHISSSIPAEGATKEVAVNQQADEPDQPKGQSLGRRGGTAAKPATGGTRESERAVAAALQWLTRHQSPDGSWSLDHYTDRCKDATCTGPGAAGAMPIAGTALGVLPFLAAGQTHESKGPYKQLIQKAIAYVVAKQRPDGSFDGATTMYDHGLASIALSECFGMTGDEKVGKAAQAALDYIAEAQDPAGGGWRYQPKMPGDTSVTGWQLTALKSGQLARLKVAPATLERATKFLRSVSSSEEGNAGGGLFGYTDKTRTTAALTAVGLLCYQHLGVPRTDPAMAEGTALLMKNLPEAGDRNVYYWFWATQVMHNRPGPDWDTWNRNLRRVLIESQATEGCAAGSWDPKAPQEDAWGQRGGRVMQTSLSALTLEVYYRYLPLYRLDGQATLPAPAGDVLELNIDSAGNVNVDGAIVSNAERYIASEAERRRTKAGLTPEQRAAGEGLPTNVLIRADSAARFEVVNRVIKACQENGFRQFAMRVANQQPPTDSALRRGGQTQSGDHAGMDVGRSGRMLVISVRADPKTGQISGTTVLEARLDELVADRRNPIDQVVIQVSRDCRYEVLTKIVELCGRQTLPDGKKLSNVSFVELAGDATPGEGAGNTVISAKEGTLALSTAAEGPTPEMATPAKETAPSAAKPKIVGYAGPSKVPSDVSKFADMILLPGYYEFTHQTVLKDLNITAEQKSKLREVQSKYQADNGKFFGERKNLPQEEVLKAHAEWIRDKKKDIQTAVEAILTPQQMATLIEITRHAEAFPRLSDPSSKVVEPVGLTLEQRDKLSLLRKVTGDWDRQNREELTEKVLAVLSPEQRAQLREETFGPDWPDPATLLAIDLGGEKGTIYLPVLDRNPDFTGEDVRKELGLSPQQQSQIRGLLGGASDLAEKLVAQWQTLPPAEQNKIEKRPPNSTLR